MSKLYSIPVGDICSDPDELARRLNHAERRVPEDERRKWRVERPALRYATVLNPLAGWASTSQFPLGSIMQPLGSL